MSWFYQPKRPVATKRNGTMMLSRFLGVWTLWGHDGTHQASQYMNVVWSKIVRHLRREYGEFEPRRCLILGVAMGATFGIVQKAWPDADVVGIDWEPDLFALGKKLGIFRPGPRLTFVEGDAAVEVPKLEGKFDLVIVDLFNGHRVADVVAQNGFRAALTDHLAEGGVLALNCYDQRQFLEEWPPQLRQPTLVRHEANTIGIFGSSERT